MSVQRPSGTAAACPSATPSQTSVIVIVGAGQAGGWAAHTLRQEGFAGRIVLIGEEKYAPYERPPLSKAILAAQALPESALLMKPSAFGALSIDWRAGTRVRRIDRAARLVTLSDGESLHYDKLILCTGGRARTLPLPGMNEAPVHTLRTIDDAVKLAPALVPGRRVAVIGGGWIGLEVSATARTKGADVVLLETQERLCARTAPTQLSDYLLALHRAQGVQLRLGVEIASLTSSADGRSQIMLADGSAVQCDAIVLGVGLVPNDELAREAGVLCDGGVVVDMRCQTSDPDILAAGDVAVAPNPWAGRRLRLESWQNGQEQGIAAARSALGMEVSYQPLPWFWSDQYGMNLQIYGLPRSDHQCVQRGDLSTGSGVLLYLTGDVIEAAVGVNAARELRFVRRLIEQRKSVDRSQLTDLKVPLSKF